MKFEVKYEGDNYTYGIIHCEYGNLEAVITEILKQGHTITHIKVMDF